MPDKHKTRKQPVSNGFTIWAIVAAVIATLNVIVLGASGHNLIAKPHKNFYNDYQNYNDNEDGEDSESNSKTVAISEPVFDFGMPNNISARTGQPAIIKCRVDHLVDKSVSWIRKRDLHILTVGTSTYTSDQRFQVTRTADSRDWILQVKFPQPRDSGIYECQVNTEPKISMAFRLNVIVIPPDYTASIMGPPDLHFKVGSVIILTCVVKQPSTSVVGPIHWYRENRLLTLFHDDDDYDDEELGDNSSSQRSNEAANDLTSRIAMESQLSDRLKSRLRIANAQKSDTGNYTCLPATANSASVMVHVINDENPAAMQKSGAAVSSCFCPSSSVLLFAALFCRFRLI